VLIIDNYDSFTFNIVQYVKILGINPIVIKNDEMTLEEIQKLKFSRIILSPGWGNPNNSGVTMSVIDFYKGKLPILGVCLGMQCLAQYFGCNVVKATEPCHGKTSKIYYDSNCQIFEGLKQGFNATRYHSLVVSNVERSPLKITAKTENDIPMAIELPNKNIYGVQFHPEAILTENGIKIFENFCKI
jgi:anthranilate synthase/aminodeoxychorismate synthase-like glutamine amidotransferase